MLNMASPASDSPSEPPIVEQVITEFSAKSLHIILESRSPYVSSRNYSVDHFLSSPSSSLSSSSSKPRDKWFNLALKECPAALENFDIWRQSNLDPLVVDVILIRRPSAPDLIPLSPGGCLLRNHSGKDRSPNSPARKDEFGEEVKSEKIVERWIIQYETRNSNSSSSDNGRKIYSGSRKHSGSSSQSPETAVYKKTYKESVIMFRSLYVLVRLLPAYKLFGELNSSGRICPLSLSHRISSYIEPFTRAEEAEMNHFSFVPIDTPCGRLSLSVSYLPTLEDVSSEPSTPLSTQFIMDYVGSPTTNPLQRFHSLPSVRMMPVPVSVSGRHSWGDDGGIPSLSPSPSPIFSESTATYHNTTRGPSHFSPVSSPSPPIHSPVGHSLLRPESAPVSTPFSKVRKNSEFALALPCPSGKATRPCCSPQSDRAQITNAPPTWDSSFGSNKLQANKELIRLGNTQTGNTLVKAPSFVKAEFENFSGCSSSSPQIPFPRGCSRFPLLDDFDDSEFPCPFADEEDSRESCYRRFELLKGKCQQDEYLEARDLVPVQRSPNAAVGELVRVLKTAVPLRKDFSGSITYSQPLGDVQPVEPGVIQSDPPASSSEATISGLFKSRTVADALEELRTYKEMILRQGGSQSGSSRSGR